MFKRWYIRWCNKRAARKLGWESEWFGAVAFDNNLTKKIKKFQKKHNLKRDGICGSHTYKILALKRRRFIKKIKTKKTNYNNG